jgi:glycosidase
MDVFGTMEDVDELIKAVHDRKMRIIFDLVLNHTSEYVFKNKKKHSIDFYFLFA